MSPDMMMPGMMMMPPGMMDGFGPMGGGMPMQGGAAAAPREEEEQQEGAAGFTVLIEGYSPYKNISELLDPPNVKDDSSRWGFITRLENLPDLFPDVPYELFAKHDITHFKVETGLVDLDEKDMPAGIGVQKEVERVPQSSDRNTPANRRTGQIRRGQDFVYTEEVLIDPMTNEEISRTYDIITQKEIDSDPELTEKDLGRKKINKSTGKELFIDRDHWFRIKAKFSWKDAPEEGAAKEAGGASRF